MHQSEFGDDHLIRDPLACLDYPEKEYDAVKKNPELSLYEDIRNDTEARNALLTGYKASGYPPVSHSEAYRAAYHPAYRIVLNNGLVFPFFKEYNRNQ